MAYLCSRTSLGFRPAVLSKLEVYGFKRSSDTQTHAEQVERQFVAQLRVERWRDLLLHFVLNATGVMVFLGSGRSSVRLARSVNAVSLPPPSALVVAAWPMIKSGELLGNIGVSVGRALADF